ncbi:uncharacterized protein PF11_0207-like [Sceloporus undulatus]|uniref:uncharacterized protein PF11_0207-like n=1 Tax=Sceloporus undulatus TaxID=8520 RepID=UPI001C4D6D4A|nr:uncharacterized protein PF11_0207-like [Sceloporus undulatus]XP_042298929.1 uncharacterized protein PF11_0207-like [Sceloporus undulatus]
MNTRKTKIESSQQRRPSFGSGSSEQTALLEELKSLYYEIKEDMKAMKRDMNAMRKEIKQEIRQEIRAELKDIKDSIGKVEEDISRMGKNMDKLEDKTEKINKKVSDFEKNYERDLDERALQDLKQRENCIKIRGLKEKDNEDLYEYLTPTLAEYVGIELDSFEIEISKMFRVNSKIAKQKRLPRDVVVYFTRKKMRDQIIQLNYEQSLEMDGEELVILKDVPLRILRKRNEYKPLAELLRNNDIPYRWDRLEGVIFRYKLETFRINSTLKMKDFLRKYKKELEKRTDNEEREKQKAKTGETPDSEPCNEEENKEEVNEKDPEGI